MIEVKNIHIEPIVKQQLRIIVLDGDVLNQNTLKQQIALLSGQLYSVDMVDSFASAQALLANNKYDILFFGLYDLSFLSQLAGSFPVLSIVAMVLEEEQEKIIAALAAGAKGYIVKNRFDLHALNNVIYYALERKRMEDIIKSVRDELEKHVQERTEDLLQANINLQNEISGHRKTEQNLQESEARLRTVLEVVNEGITFSDERGFFYIYNPAMEKLTGYSMQEANASSDFSRLIYPNPEDWNMAISGIADLIYKGATREIESKIVTKDRQVKYVLIFSSLINYNGRKMFLSVYRDITERKKYEEELKMARENLEQKVKERTHELEDINEELKTEILERRQAQKKLQESESRYRLLAENVSDVVWLTNMNFRWLYISPSIINLLGYTAQEARAMKIEEFLTESSAEYIKKIVQQDLAFNKDLMRSRTLELECRRKDGVIIWVETKTNIIYNTLGQPFRIMGVSSDITERRNTMTKLMESLQEKEILLKEIHHRVKNNLQIVSSLLNLQSLKVQDSPAMDIFKESHARIKSMALIHEKLYQSSDLAKIDFAEYVKNLSKELFNSYKVNTSLIKININMQNVFLDIDTAIPCGLIINELVSNSLKYAFASNKEGQINIEFNQREDGLNILVVNDTGKGMPQDLDLKNIPSLGLQLVNSLTKQLGGVIELDRNWQGAYIKIIFKYPKK